MFGEREVVHVTRQIRAPHTDGVDEGTNRRPEPRWHRRIASGACECFERGSDLAEVAQERPYERHDGAGRIFGLEPVAERREARDPPDAERFHRLVSIDRGGPVKWTRRFVVVSLVISPPAIGTAGPSARTRISESQRSGRITGNARSPLPLP